MPWFLPPHRVVPVQACIVQHVCLCVFSFICTCIIMYNPLCSCLEVSVSFSVNACVCECELAYRCEDKHSSLCSTFSCFLAQLFNDGNILLKWRRRRWRRRRMDSAPLVMWSDPRWAFHIKVEWVCFLFASDVLLSQFLSLERNLL